MEPGELTPEEAAPTAGVDGSAAALPAATRIGRVTLAVRDLDGVAAFYRRTLGLVAHVLDGQVAELGTPEAAWLRLERSAAPARERGTPGLYHVAVLLPDRAALGAWLRHAVDAGVRLHGAADHGVSEAVYLADPEGNGLEVYRDRPRSSWARDGTRVRMITEALDGDGLLAAARGAWRGVPPGTVVGHLHLQVPDLAAAGRLYGEGVGFALTTDAYPGALFYAAGGYHHHVGLNTWGLNTRGLNTRVENTRAAGTRLQNTGGQEPRTANRGGPGTRGPDTRSASTRNPDARDPDARDGDVAGTRRASPSPEGALGLRGFDLRVPSARDVAAAVARLNAIGVAAATSDGGRSVTLLEPSGAELRLVADTA